MSPGHPGGVRQIDHVTFMSQAKSAIMAADWLGVHAYWSNYAPMTTKESHTGVGVVNHATRYGKPIIVTEASHNLPGLEPAEKAKQYLQFPKLIEKYPNIIGVTYFVISATNPAFGWKNASCETWDMDMAKVIGDR